MPNYRRARIPGGTYFFTVNLLERKRSLLVDRHDVLMTAFRTTRARFAFRLHGWVSLPDHIHCLWTLPEGDANNGMRWRYLKTLFCRGIEPHVYRCPQRIKKGERGIWQRRYWEHAIQNADDFCRHLDYIHANPVKHGHVMRTADWPHSTFHRYVARGVYPQDWGDA